MCASGRAEAYLLEAYLTCLLQSVEVGKNYTLLPRIALLIYDINDRYRCL
jgi:hypothetical protein